MGIKRITTAKKCTQPKRKQEREKNREKMVYRKNGEVVNLNPNGSPRDKPTHIWSPYL